MVQATASVTAWMTELSTMVIGGFGAFFTVWQFRAQGFRPKCTVKIDLRREAVLVQIENRGRAEGVIARVVIVDDNGLALDPSPSVEGFPAGYAPTRLPALASMRLIIARPNGTAAFPNGIKVKVDWGTGETMKTPLPVDVGYLGMSSVLPPTGNAPA